MSDTTFSAGTVVASSWLNDINDFVYGNVKTLKQLSVPEDGTTDVTTLLQAALDSGATRIIGTPGVTYVVSYAGGVTVNGAAQRYCIKIPTGVVFDLNGATLKAANASNSSIVMLDSTSNAGLINGKLDGNKSNQTTPATGEIANVFGYNNTNLLIQNITAYNCRMYAGRFLANVKATYFNLKCLDSDADGWSFGTTGTAGELREFDCILDHIYAENCTQVYSVSYQGNPVIITAKRAVVGTIMGKDCAGGLKIQDMSEDVNVASALFTGNANGTVNSGFKIQGNAGASLYPKRINVANVTVSNAFGNGLRITEVDSVCLGSYTGGTNGSGASATGSDKYDVYLDTANGSGNKSISISNLQIDTPTTVGINTVGNGNIKIDSWSVRGCTGSAFLDAMSGGTLFVGYGQVTDVSSGLTYAFRSTGSVRGSVGPLDCSAAASLTTTRATVATGNYKLSVGPIRLNGVALEGIVTLTNGATSTTVSNASVWREFVGGGGEYFHPDITISPISSTSRALGSMYAVVTDYDTGAGTGFSIKHATAGASDKVKYFIGPMSVWTETTT